MAPPSLCGRLLATAVLGLAASASHAGCDLRSGPRTTALVELYTSEGCSSCPPADRQLSQLRQALAPDADAVALALHVDYWDAIGWKDPFAQAAFGLRQRGLVQANGHRTVYTPHFFVSGTELREWQGRIGAEVARQNRQPAAAALHLRADAATAGALHVQADASTADPAQPAALYLAVAEDGLVSKVARGENGGATLAHDHVVRAWFGPLPLLNGSAHAERQVLLPPGWRRDRLSVVAFVQNPADARVLQALSASQCTGS